MMRQAKTRSSKNKESGRTLDTRVLSRILLIVTAVSNMIPLTEWGMVVSWVESDEKGVSGMVW
jgi:hypothetical protein